MGIPALKWRQHTNMHVYAWRPISLVVTNPILKVWKFPHHIQLRKTRSGLFLGGFNCWVTSKKNHKLLSLAISKCSLSRDVKFGMKCQQRHIKLSSSGRWCTRRCWHQMLMRNRRTVGPASMSMTEEVHHACIDIVTVKSCDCYCTFQAVACNVYTVCMTLRL